MLSLAATPPANEFVSESELHTEQERIPLTLVRCRSCAHVQLAEIVDPERLFRKYVYVSGTSPVFVSHFGQYASNLISRFSLDDTCLVVDVGSNDGTLLKQFKQAGATNVLGIDPATRIAETARSEGIPTIDEFFTPALATDIRKRRGPARLISANNVFAHSADLSSFSHALAALLDDRGVFVFEVSYLADVIQGLLFDTIYHEHTSYHTVTPLLGFFDQAGLRLFDVERIGTHGGSIRGYVCRRNSSHEDTQRLRELIAM